MLRYEILLLLAVSVGCRPRLDSAARLAKSEADTPEVAKFKQNRPLQCKGSNAPLFLKGESEKPKKLIFKADFISRFSGSGTNGYGLIYDAEAANDYFKYVPLAIEARGNSRRSYCELKPLRLKFILQPATQEAKGEAANDQVQIKGGIAVETHKKIISDINAKGLASDAEKVEYYYQQLDQIMRSQTFPEKGFPQDEGSRFDRIGNDIKLVNHCGKSAWGDISGDKFVTQRTRLLQEFYIYRILNELDTTFIKTSLADITYIPAGSDQPKEFDGFKSGMAFFRESKARLAKRCGLLAEAPNGNRGDANPISLLQGEFFSQFLANMDVGLDSQHNTEIIYDSNSARFYSPYDFDLSGVITDTYFKNSGNLEEKGKKFGLYLSKYVGNEIMISQVLYLLGKWPKIEATAMAGEKEIQALDESAQPRFTKWLSIFKTELSNFVELNREKNGDYIKAVQEHIASHSKAKEDK